MSVPHHGMIGAGCLAILFGAAVALIFAGCASTTIDTPIFTYRSNRDSDFRDVKIEIVETPDGKTTTIEIGAASGQASPVIDAQTEMLRIAIEAAFRAGLTAAPGG